jgi:Cof subfamily protein (haloacid dehalogenase superfamily)
MLIEPLGITTLLIGFNGGVVTTTDFSILTEHLLSPEIARHAVGLLDANQVQVWVFSGQDWFVRDSGGPYVRKEEHTVAFGPTVVENFGSTLDAAAKIVGVSRDFGLLARCESDVRTALADSAFVVRSQPYYLDVTNPFANKGTALTDVAKLLGVPLAEIAVIGDGGNDIAMFERSGLSIAMGNASSEVQQAADLVTDSNEEEGFANAIERFILGITPSDVQAGRARSGVRA